MATNTNVAAVVGDGTILRFGIGTATVSTATATSTNDMGIVTRVAPEPAHEPVEVTALDSNGVKQYIAGLRDATLSLEVELDSENDHHNDIIAGCLAGTQKNFAIIPNNDGTNAAGVTYSGAAFVTATPMEFPTGEKQTMSVTLQVSGVRNTTSGVVEGLTINTV